MPPDNRWFPGFDFVRFGPVPSITSLLDLEDEDEPDEILAEGAD
jgi:hypothetical protein